MALERFGIAMLVGIDREPEENRLVGARGKLDQLSERVGLLAVENAVTPDRAVAAPVRDGRQRVELDPLRRSPFAEHDRREGRDPPKAVRRDVAAGSADRLPYGHELRVACEANVDSLGVPKLVEDGVEVEVNPGQDRLAELLVTKHSRHVDEEVCSAGPLAQPRVRHAGAVAPARLEERGIALQPVRGDHCLEVADVLRGERVNRLDEEDVVAEPAEAEQVLEDGPGGAPVVRHACKHAAEDDSHGSASSRNLRRTLSESKNSSARARAACAWRS